MYGLGKRLSPQAMGGRVKKFTLRLFACCGRPRNEASRRFGVGWVKKDGLFEQPGQNHLSEMDKLLNWGGVLLVDRNVFRPLHDLNRLEYRI